MVVTATSLPIALYLTILGGFLFGPVIALIVIDLSATLGATLLFLTLKTTLGELFQEKATPWIKKMEAGFQKNAFSYLLSLRLVPIFPFWAVTIAAPFLNVPTPNFCPRNSYRYHSGDVRLRPFGKWSWRSFRPRSYARSLYYFHP